MSKPGWRAAGGIAKRGGEMSWCVSNSDAGDICTIDWDWSAAAADGSAADLKLNTSVIAETANKAVAKVSLRYDMMLIWGENQPLIIKQVSREIFGGLKRNSEG
jgi:hypothetical protein